jgi:hypothetical protein
VDSSPETRHSVRWGAAPPTGSAIVGPCLSRAHGKQMSGACHRRWGELTGMKPGRGVRVPSSAPEQRSRSCRCPGPSARHLRQGLLGSGLHCAANARSTQTTTRWPRRPVASLEDRTSPLLYVYVHQAKSYVIYVTLCCTATVYHVLQALRRRQRDGRTLPHAGSHGKAEEPIKLESQEAEAGSAAPGASRPPKRGATGFPNAPTAGAGQDQAHPYCAAGGGSRTRSADRPRRRTRCRLARDRYSARGHQAGGPSALSAPPS